MKIPLGGILLSYFLFPSLTFAEVAGLIDMRAIKADNTEAWLYEGLGKQRFDDAHDGIKLGQGILDLRGNLTDTITGKIVFNAYDDRKGTVDITEAYLQWKPLPFNGYRFKGKVGAFFPSISLENNGVGWSNPWMLSTSAINTWVGEELRTIGAEVSWGRPGILHNSPHDLEFNTAIFTANDPATSLLAWRGWSIGDRVTGLTESIPLPHLPTIYGPNSIFDSQGNLAKPFVEIDHRYGYYVGVSYSYNNWINVRALHYSNRGDPLGIYESQWSWLTNFNHVSVKIDFENNVSILSQAMRGETRWGTDGYGVYAAYEAWYLLLSQELGKHRVSARYDNFRMIDEDRMPGDDNSENGQALAVTWMYKLNGSNQFGAEYLKILSKRAGRGYLGGDMQEQAGIYNLTENTLQIFYRYSF